MSSNFPAALDNGTSLPNPSSGNAPNSPSHAGLHDNENSGIIATQTKVGTGASTPVVNTFLLGTGTGTSAWTSPTSAQVAAAVSDETGSGALVFATTPSLVTPKVDTINESTLNNGVTVGGVNLKAGFMSGTNLTAGTVGSSQLATGVAVQAVSTTFSAVATGTTVIPFDDTIPQITEGTEFMTQVITPKSVTDLLIIQVNTMSTLSVADDLIGALFQDSTANALAATASFNATATGRNSLSLTYRMAAGTTSATTFRVRLGGASASTVTFNGSSGARKFGGISLSSMTITEYKA